MAKVRKANFFLLKVFFIIFLTSSSPKALEIIRDAELELFTDDILSILLNYSQLETDDLNVYFIKSNQVNAFVTGGKNIFINTEVIIKSEDYREYASVLAHELAHIIGGHIFNTSVEITNLSLNALPIYLLGIVGIMAGATETGIAGVMVGQASVNDGYTYYSRTQEASADQAAVSILCKNKIDAKYLVSFLEKLNNLSGAELIDDRGYRSTHPKTESRITWINSSLNNNHDCNYKINEIMQKRFEFLKAKLHGYTHHHSETESQYNKGNDIDLYATAVSSYFQGNHSRSIKNLETLISKYPENPFYKELIGEIYFANNNYEKATFYQKNAISDLQTENDIYFMILGNYLLSYDINEKSMIGIEYLKKSIHLNPKNAYSWYLLGRAYAQIDNIPLANYASAERYFLIGERSLSYEFALKALKNIEQYSPEWYRSFDLIEVLKKEVSTNR